MKILLEYVIYEIYFIQSLVDGSRVSSSYDPGDDGLPKWAPGMAT